MAHTSSLFLVLLLGVLASTVQGANDGFLVLRGTSEYSMDSMSELYVADLISHVSGLPPVHQQTDRSAFPKSNLFSSPEANLFVAIDSVTPELLNQAQTRFLNVENDNLVTIMKSDYPEDSLSTLTTIMTGEHYTEHGIVGNSWAITRDVSVDAFSKEGNCKSLKIADRVAAQSEGGSRIISVSANKKMAAAMAVNSELAQANPEWNNDALYYSKKGGLVNMNTGAVERTFQDIADFGRRNAMTLKTAEGHMLATELYAIALIPKRLALMSRADNVEAPDMINIAIGSVRALTLRYGEGSPQVLDALRLIDSTLSTVYEELESRYNGNVVTEIVGLQSTTSEHTFYTQTKQQTAHRIMEDNEPSTTTYTQADVSAYQTKLWVAVAFVVAVILGVLALVKMDMLEDSLIYRTTDGPRPIPNVS